jgi:hypothetical protein
MKKANFIMAICAAANNNPENVIAIRPENINNMTVKRLNDVKFLIVDGALNLAKVINDNDLQSVKAVYNAVKCGVQAKTVYHEIICDFYHKYNLV